MVSVALALMVAGCVSERRTESLPERRIALAGEAVWSIESMADVGQMAASAAGSLIVSDDLTSEIVAFDITTGLPRWRAGGRGRGPGEFGRIGSVTIRDQEVLVVDSEQRRVSFLRAADGALTGSLATQRVYGLPRSACALTPDTVLIATVPGDSLWSVPRDGTAAVARSGIAPERDPRGILTDVVTSGGMGGACVLAATRHPLFAVITPGGSTRTITMLGDYLAPRWVRSADGDTLSHQLISTVDVEVAGGAAWLLRSGAGDQRGRLIDVHDLATGAYVVTLEVPRRTAQIAVGGGLVMARVRDSMGVSRIDAYPLPADFPVR